MPICQENLRDSTCDICGERVGVIPPDHADINGTDWCLCSQCAEAVAVQLRKFAAQNAVPFALRASQRDCYKAR